MNTEPATPYRRRVEAILDLMEDGIFISDRHGRTLRVNRAYEKLSGFSHSDLIDRNVRELVEQGVFNRALNPEIVRTGKSAVVVQELGREKKTILLRGFPIFDEHGDVDLVVTFARDITAITQLREQIVEQRNVIERYQGGVAHILQQRNADEGIFVSRAMRDLLPPLVRAAETDATVLLLGETGVGKDVLARLAHARSPRKDKMFMKVDCAGIAESLLESELFGYAKGAFSGAESQGRAGYFEIADGGTVFLDEIGEMPMPMQAKLLRILQDKEFMRVGSSRLQKVDVRIIAATNKDLAVESEQGRFRRDLYYRLNVAKFAVPSLRERLEDIVPLARHFLDIYNQKYKKHARLSLSAESALPLYAWPGNVRELANLIQRLVITCEREMIGLSDLPERVRSKLPPDESEISPAGVLPDLSAESRPLKDVMAEIEVKVLQEALHRLGSVNGVAEFFQINRSTVFRKLHPQTRAR